MVSKSIRTKIYSTSVPVQEISKAILKEFEEKGQDLLSSEEKQSHWEFIQNFNAKKTRDDALFESTLSVINLIFKLAPVLMKTTKMENLSLDKDLEAKVKKLYDNYPPELKKRFDERGKISREKAINEATPSVSYFGKVISIIIGNDVTREDVRNKSGFYDSKGKGPVFFKKQLQHLLGTLIWENQSLHELFVGAFRDVWEFVPMDDETTETQKATIKWLRQYLDVVQPYSALLLGASVFSIFAFNILENVADDDESLIMKKSRYYVKNFFGVSSIFRMGDVASIATPTIDPGAYAYNYKIGLCYVNLSLLCMLRHFLNVAVLTNIDHGSQSDISTLRTVLEETNKLSDSIGLSGAIEEYREKVFQIIREDKSPEEEDGEEKELSIARLNAIKRLKAYSSQKGAEKSHFFMPNNYAQKAEFIERCMNEISECFLDGRSHLCPIPFPKCLQGKLEGIKNWLSQLQIGADITASSLSFGARPSYLLGLDAIGKQRATAERMTSESGKGDESGSFSDKINIIGMGFNFMDAYKDRTKRFFFRKCEALDCTKILLWRANSKSFKSLFEKEHTKTHGFSKAVHRIMYLHDLPGTWLDEMHGDKIEYIQVVEYLDLAPKWLKDQIPTDLKCPILKANNSRIYRTIACLDLLLIHLAESSTSTHRDQVSEMLEGILGTWSVEIDNLVENNEIPLKYICTDKEDSAKKKGYTGCGKVMVLLPTKTCTHRHKIGEPSKTIVINIPKREGTPVIAYKDLPPIYQLAFLRMYPFRPDVLWKSFKRNPWNLVNWRFGTTIFQNDDDDDYSKFEDELAKKVRVEIIVGLKEEIKKWHLESMFKDAESVKASIFDKANQYLIENGFMKRNSAIYELKRWYERTIEKSSGKKPAIESSPPSVKGKERAIESSPSVKGKKHEIESSPSVKGKKREIESSPSVKGKKRAIESSPSVKGKKPAIESSPPMNQYHYEIGGPSSSSGKGKKRVIE